MSRRTQEQWLALFDQQKTSGLNYTDFAKSKGISPKYFSLRRSQLKPTTRQVNNKSGNFVEAKVKPNNVSYILVEHKQSRIKLPSNISVNWLVQFVHQLG